MTMPVHRATGRETLAEFPFFAAERFASRPAQRFKRDGSWQDLSYAAVGEVTAEIALGLIALGIRPGDRVAVLADTRPEWVQAEFGIAAAGAVVVPIYPSSAPEECRWAIGNSGAVAVIVENAAQLAKVEQVRSQLTELRHVILIEAAAEPAAAGTTTSLDQLRGQGRRADSAELGQRVSAVQPDDPALIIYTSGTTGRPKGCVLTHRNMTACCSIVEELKILGAEDVTYLFLPLAHVFAQVVQLGTGAVGGVVAYCSGGAAAIMADCAELAPTCLPAVPRIFEKVYAAFASQVPAEMLAGAVACGRAAGRLRAAGQPLPDELRASFDQADAQLFGKVRAVFGGRLREPISGAAPIAPEILEFFHAAGVPVHEGWGLSESAGVGTFNTSGATRIGTIGLPVPGSEIRFADDGEILMRGPQVFAGYWNNPDATAEMLIDGWLQSGDLGSADDDGFVTITGRKKDIIITAGGKNLTPANLENELRQSQWISQAVMHGDRRPYPVVLITLDAEQVAPWARQQGLPDDMAKLAVHPAVRALIEPVVAEVNARRAQVAQVKKFVILDHDLSQETGELTPTLKVKRRVVEVKYAQLFDALYGGPA
jgi:long-chain acyl-CoA synthetase